MEENRELIWKIWKKDKLNSERFGKLAFESVDCFCFYCFGKLVHMSTNPSEKLYSLIFVLQ